MRLHNSWLIGLYASACQAATQPLVLNGRGLGADRRQSAAAMTTTGCTTRVTRTVRGPPAGTVYVTETIHTGGPCLNCNIETVTVTVGGGGGGPRRGGGGGPPQGPGGHHDGPGGHDGGPPLVTITTLVTEFTCFTLGTQIP